MSKNLGINIETSNLQEPWRRKDIILLSIIFLASLLMRFPPYFPPGVSGDAANYIKLAWSMRYATEADPVLGVLYSFGYSIFIYLASFVINDLDKAAFVVSIVFGVLASVMLFLLGRVMFGTRVALVAALAFVFFQPHISLSQSALGDSTYIFWALLSTYLLVKGFLAPKPLYHYAMTGAVVGFTFIIRPEIQIAFFAITGFGLYLLWSKHSVKLAKLALIAVILAASFFVVNIPKLAWMHKVTGHWILDGRKNFTVTAADKFYGYVENSTPLEQVRREHEEALYGLSDDGDYNFMKQRSFLKWLVDDPRSRFGYYWYNVKLSLNNVDIRIGTALLLALLSFIISKKGDRNKPALMAAYFTPLLAIPFFYSIGRGSFYARTEPAVAYAPLLILLAAYGLIMITEKFGRARYLIIAFTLVAWSGQALAGWTPRIGQVATANDAPGYVEMDMYFGTILDDMLPKGAKVMCVPWGLARYSNHETVLMPLSSYPRVMEYARKKGIDYIVVGGASEWYRPEMNFLLPAYRRDYVAYYDQDLELIFEEVHDVEGVELSPRMAVYKLKK